MNNPNNLPECHTCIFFQNHVNATGFCHLNPPTPTLPINEKYEIGELPLTWKTNYCGFHKEKNNE